MQINDQVNVTLPEGTLSIRPLTENAVRIKFYKETEPSIPELIFTSNVPAPVFQVADLSSTIEIKMKNMMVVLDKQTGHLSFADHSGKIFLSEKAGTRRLTPNSVMGEPCFMAEQSFESPNDEYIFGLGQFQDGHYNLKGITRRLTQVNSQISIPFIYSSKGYGLLWHEYGLTDFNPADNIITLEKQEQSDAGNNQVAEVTTTSGTQKVSQNQSLYLGVFKVPVDGEYSIFLDLGDMDNRQYVYEDENDNYNYEKGAYSTITFKWDDEKKALTIKDRQGSFPGMLNEHTFNIVLVKENKGIGVEMPILLDKTIKYSGKEAVIDF